MHHVCRPRRRLLSNLIFLKQRRFVNNFKPSKSAVDQERLQHPVSNSYSENSKENVCKDEGKTNSLEKQNKGHKSAFRVSSDDGPRFNHFNIQMVSKAIHEQLFQNVSHKTAGLNEIQKCVLELKKHDLMSKDKKVDDVKINLPKLEGKNIEEHFYNIGENQSGPYRKLLLNLMGNIPKVPEEWLFQPGWTRYSDDGAIKVDFPEDDALVFDVEVCCTEGDLPTMATAVSTKAWYSWVSLDLINGSKNIGNKHYSPDYLIPLESGPKQRGYKLNDSFKSPRVVVGHNVSYDRVRVKEQYWLERTGLRFVDTMSLHTCVSGVTSYQKALLKAGLGEDDEWSKLSSLNNLSKVHNLYCGSELSKEERQIFVTGTLTDIQKNFHTLMSYCASDVIATHNVFSKLLPMFLERFPHPVTLAGMLELGLSYLPVNSNWQRYINDANLTFEDLGNEAKFLLAQHADQACQLLHNEEYKKHLWLWDEDWTVKELKLKKKPSPKKSKTKKVIVESQLESDSASQVIECDSKWDDWERDEHKDLENKFKYLLEMENLLPVKMTHLPGYPEWYRKLCHKITSSDWIPGPDMISTSMQIAPKLLSLTWKSLPLHFVRGHGWGQLVPYRTEIPVESETVPMKELINYCQNVDNGSLCKCEFSVNKSHSSIHEDVQTSLVKFLCKKDSKKQKNKQSKMELTEGMCKAVMGEGCGLVKLPHKDGAHLNVGNPLAKDFIYKFSDNGLASSGSKAERIIEISRMLSYWRNNKERIEKQVVVWLSKKDIPKYIQLDELGVILPQVIVSGTLTRRAVEPTWMTASNAVDERVGSELRSMIQAPPGYCLVGADVDSQELWIASIIGDAYSVGEHGATPFGWMTLSGQKSDGTDMHSITAKAVGISRGNAKIINYARIYGAGQRFAERLLKQFNPDMTVTEAKQKATKMFTMTKGKRVYPLKNNVLPEIKERLHNRFSAQEICSVHGKSVEELFDKTKWIGGTESAMFNCLEEIASNAEPKTPFLKGRLSRALEPKTDSEDRFIPTRINWVVQSGAVDFLHLMLASMRWLLGPNIRFCLSFHDEVRYIVPEDDKYQAALALHITNLYTRAFCVHQLGMTDLPQSIAFFASVEVDKVLRKEANHDCKTPSNPHGLTKGYGIPLGESLNVFKSVVKAKGVVGIPKFRTKKLKINNENV